MAQKQDEKLLGIFRALSADDQAAVTAFAEFLKSRVSTVSCIVETQSNAEPSVPVQIPEPEVIERPGDEKVVAAVKRLSKSYFMLDKKKMLGVTSDLVTQHILQGREASEVIDELEVIFHDHYKKLKKGEDQ